MVWEVSARRGWRLSMPGADANEYTGLFFVVADSPAALRRNLASLCVPALLNLPEQDIPKEEPQTLAVIRWLQTHSGWLLILDNLDTEDRARRRESARPASRRACPLHGPAVEVEHHRG